VRQALSIAGRGADRPKVSVWKSPTVTLADIPAGTALFRYFELEIERPFIPNVEAWYRRLQERTAYRENVMVPFDELRGRLDY
jgi:glutathione S-transferase